MERVPKLFLARGLLQHFERLRSPVGWISLEGLNLLRKPMLKRTISLFHVSLSNCRSKERRGEGKIEYFPIDRMGKRPHCCSGSSSQRTAQSRSSVAARQQPPISAREP